MSKRDSRKLARCFLCVLGALWTLILAVEVSAFFGLQREAERELVDFDHPCRNPLLPHPLNADVLTNLLLKGSVATAEQSAYCLATRRWSNGLDVLLRALEQTSGARKGAIARGLQTMSSPRLIPAFVQLLAESQESGARNDGLNGLEDRSDDDGLVSYCGSLLSSAAVKQREIAAECLGEAAKTKDAVVIPLLRRALEDPAEEVRQQAALRLVMRTAPAAQPDAQSLALLNALADRARRDSLFDYGLEAATALERLGDPRAAKSIYEASNDFESYQKYTYVYDPKTRSSDVRTDTPEPLLGALDRFSDSLLHEMIDTKPGFAMRWPAYWVSCSLFCFAALAVALGVRRAFVVISAIPIAAVIGAALLSVMLTAPFNCPTQRFVLANANQILLGPLLVGTVLAIDRYRRNIFDRSIFLTITAISAVELVVLAFSSVW